MAKLAAIFSSVFILFLAYSSTAVTGSEIETSPLGNWWKILQVSYPKYAETTALLKEIQAKYPHEASLYSIGKSVEGRELLVIKLGENVTASRPLLRPMVKIVANMHGDETLGRQLVLLLTVHLLNLFDSKDSRAVNLLRSTEIHLMPSLNPDGFEVAMEGFCDPNPLGPGRRNANGVDLNRDFPDQFLIHPSEDSDNLAIRQPETASAMEWIKSHPFVLSANLHAGAVVASYPFDSVPPEVLHDPNYKGTGFASVSPDDKFFRYVTQAFAKAHRTMNQSSHCGEKFKDGVTNGADWYNIYGGMQDYNYVNTNCFEITLELSCCKFPNPRTIREEWDNNREAFMQFLEASHLGVKGVVLDADSKLPIKDAAVEVEGINHPVYTTPQGEYWRLLAPGEYRIRVVARKYAPSEWEDILVDRVANQVVNFTLSRKGGKGSGPREV